MGGTIILAIHAEKRLSSPTNSKKGDAPQKIAQVNMARIEHKLPSLLLYKATTYTNSKGQRTSWNNRIKVSYKLSKIKRKEATNIQYQTAMANLKKDLEALAELVNSSKP
jgi:hypothetical protein